MQQKCWKWLYWPAFGLRSTQTLVKIYNIRLYFVQRLKVRIGDQGGSICWAPNSFYKILSFKAAAFLVKSWKYTIEKEKVEDLPTYYFLFKMPWLINNSWNILQKMYRISCERQRGNHNIWSKNQLIDLTRSFKLYTQKLSLNDKLKNLV